MSELTIQINAPEIEKIQKAISAFGEVAKKEVEKALIAAAKVVQTRAKQLCPARSIAQKIMIEKPSISFLTFRIRIKPKDPRSHLFEFGTGIFNINTNPKSKALKDIIPPKRAKALRFVDAFMGKPKYFMYSRGMRPKPFMNPAAEQTRGEQIKAFKDSMAAGLK